MIPLKTRMTHTQGDRWPFVFKVGADLSAHSLQMVISLNGTASITCKTSDATMTATYAAAETISAAGVTETGVTTITPVITLVQSAALTAGVYSYELEDLTDNDTYFTGQLTVEAQVSS